MTLDNECMPDQEAHPVIRWILETALEFTDWLGILITWSC